MPILLLSGFLTLLAAVSAVAPVGASGTGQETTRSSRQSEDREDQGVPPEVELVQPATSVQTPIGFSRLFLDNDGRPFLGAHSDAGVFLHNPKDGWQPLPGLNEPEAVWGGETGIAILDAIGPGPTFVIKRFDRRGHLLSSFPLDGNPDYVSGFTVDSEGLIYVNDASHEDGIISVYSPQGTLLRRFVRPLPAPGLAERALLNQAWVAWGSGQTLLVAFRFEPRFRIYDGDGRILVDTKVVHPLVRARRAEELREIPERFVLDEYGRTVLRAFVYFTTATALADGRYALGFGDGSFVFFVSPEGRLERIWQLTVRGEPCRTFDYWDSNLAVAQGRVRIGAGSVSSSRPGRILDFVLPGGQEEVEP